MKKYIKFSLKLILVTLIFAISIIIPTILIPVSPEIISRITEEMQTNMLGSMLLVSLLGTVSLFVNIKFSQWSGLKLILALSISFFGIQYFMAQIETFYFREAFTFMTNGEILNILLRGLITTIIVVSLTVIIFRKDKIDKKINIKATFKQIKIYNLLKKAVLFSVLYIIIYLFFGYYVAWQFEAVRLFYSGNTENLGFINQIVSTIDKMPFFLPYHFLRGLLWIFFSIPIILMMAGSRKKTVISLMLLFSYHGFQIIMAQGFFPPEVLFGHTIETTISAALYGGLVGYMFYLPEEIIVELK